MTIHPTSVVSPEAEIDSDVVVGPFCVIYGGVKIGSGTRLESHVVVGSETGVVELGKNNQIFQSAALGGSPQHTGYKGEKTRLVIGDDNIIREFCTINIGTIDGGGETRIGDHNLIMTGVHLGHDGRIGSHVTIGNNTHFGGHCEIFDHVSIGGVCSFNQNIRIGEYSFIAGDATVNKDILPYGIAQGKYAVIRGTNKIGLQRAGLSEEAINQVNRAIRIFIKGSSTIEEALEKIQSECEQTPEIKKFTSFIKSSQRGIAK